MEFSSLRPFLSTPQHSLPSPLPKGLIPVVLMLLYSALSAGSKQRRKLQPLHLSPRVIKERVMVGPPLTVGNGTTVFKRLKQHGPNHPYTCFGRQCEPLRSWEDYWQSLPTVVEGLVEEFDDRRRHIKTLGRRSIFVVHDPSGELRTLASQSLHNKPYDDITGLYNNNDIVIKSIVVPEGKEYPALLEAFVQQHVLPTSPFLLPVLGVYKQLKCKEFPPCIHLILPAMRLDLRAATVAALRGRLTIDFRLLLAEMVLGVEAMHAAGYIHRDVKPHNYLISPEGHVVLADFDGVWPMGMSVSNQEDVQGTANYASPEVMKAFEDISTSAVPDYDMWGDTVELLYEPVHNKERGKITNGFAFKAGSDVWSLGITAKEVSGQLQRLGVLPDSALLSDLLDRMTMPAETRATIDDIKHHPYFSKARTFQAIHDDPELRPVHFQSSLGRTGALLRNRRGLVVPL